VTESGVYLGRMATRQRREERVSAARPVRLDRGTGVTENVSASGVFFETNVDYAVGSKISFVIELEGLREEKSMLRCQGEIVRVEHRDGKVGVAARIVASRVDSAV
jgi:hypothetical protein